MITVASLRRHIVRIFFLSTLTLPILVGGGPVHAGGFIGCKTPFVFGGAAANIVPIQYQATIEKPAGAANRESYEAFKKRVTQTAKRLAWLTKISAWHQPTFGSLGVVAHMEFGERCNADEVIMTLFDKKLWAMEHLQPGRVVVILHGRIFQEGDEIYLQSVLRALRAKPRLPEGSKRLEDYLAAEGLSLKLPVSSTAEPMRGVLSLGRIAFPPRRLTLAELDWIEKQSLEASKIYKRKSTEAESEIIKFSPNRPKRFSISFSGADWLFVKEQQGGEEGYIKRDIKASNALHEKMPELDFLNGTLGFLRFQQALQETAQPMPRGALGQIRRAFANYSKRKVAAGDAATLAMADAMIGVLEAQVAKNWTAAHTRFEAAVRKAPYNGAYRNLLAMAETYLCCVAKSGKLTKVNPVTHLVDALSVNPRDRTALANLDVYFSFLKQKRASEVPEGVDMRALAERHARVQAVRKARRD